LFALFGPRGGEDWRLSHLETKKKRKKGSEGAIDQSQDTVERAKVLISFFKEGGVKIVARQQREQGGD